jgi:hypothetical protein
MPCPCPDFAVLERDDDGQMHGSSLVYAFFPKTVVNGNEFSSSRYAGNTLYVMTGYFSGRMIDHYEWTRQQTGQESRRPSDEEFHEWRSRYPEFCVESWCAIPDKDPVGARNPWRHDAKNYGKHVAAMRKAGVAFCAESANVFEKAAPRARGDSK